MIIYWYGALEDNMVIKFLTSLQFPTTQNISMLTGSLAIRSMWSLVELLMGLSGLWF